MGEPPHNPHDALFRRTFSVAENAVGELQSVLPQALAARVDWGTLQLCDASFVDAALATAYSDLLFSVTVSARPALVYILFEHQSRADRLMPLRLLGYVVRVVEQHVQANGKALPLPAVIPVVLHHSETGWTAARNLQALFDPTLLADPEIRGLVPHMDFLLDDVSHLADEDLARRPMTPEAHLALWALRDARNGRRLLATLTFWAEKLVVVASQSEEALRTLARYILSVADSVSVDDLTSAVRAAAPQTESEFMTIAEQLIQQGKNQGRSEGLAEGRSEGRNEGRIEGLAGVLERQLVLKFGPLSDDVRARIRGATEFDLSRWTERILTATCPDDLFA